jgi:hypothetical protein
MSKALTNAQIIKAIGLDESINSTTKYTLIICVHVCMDWSSWSAAISADQIAEASAQSSRQVKRHLKSLIESGWLTRSAEVRGPGLHHKSYTRLNLSKVREVLDHAVTDLVRAPDHDVTYLVNGSDHDVTDLVSRPSWSTNYVTPTVTDLVSHDVTDLVETLPKVSHSSISLNYTNQSLSNLSDAEPSSDSVREREAELDAEEQARADLWDQLMPEPEPITEELIGSIWVVSRIDDDLAYKREIMRQIEHHERWDIKRALWNRQEGDQLFAQMKADLIAPRSAIDWVTTQAAGHPPAISTPAAPAPKPKTYTVTLSDVERRRQIDKAWAEGWDQ